MLISRLLLRREYRRIRSGVDDPGREKKCGDYFYLNTPPEEEEEDLDELFRSLLRGEQQFFANTR